MLIIVVVVATASVASARNNFWIHLGVDPSCYVLRSGLTVAAPDRRILTHHTCPTHLELEVREADFEKWRGEVAGRVVRPIMIAIMIGVKSHSCFEMIGFFDC